MKIVSIELSNWRAYQSATFNFDISDKSKNCVLIGAPNGFGKTSLFEALTLCIFGKKGLPLLARASNKGRTDTPYDRFLSSIIHKKALASVSKRLSVKLSFISSDNTKIRVERSWYFNPSGMHKPGDEQFTLWIGDQVQAPEQGQDRTEWESELINRYFVPHSLAQFFLFDGEMVRDLARMDQAAQVRKGIEGLMGVPILRNLTNSLENYAIKKRAGVRNPKSGTNPADIGIEIEKLDNRIQELTSKIDDLDTILSGLTKEQKELFDELASFGSTDQSQKVTLHQRLNDAEKQRDEVFNGLQNKLITDFSIGLVGRDVMLSAIGLLDSDQILEEWEASKNQGEKGYDNFIKTLSDRLKADTSIPAKHHPEVVNLIESTWGSIWHPKPEGCPSEQTFSELNGAFRSKIRERLQNLLNESGAGLQSSYLKYDELERVVEQLNTEIKNADVIGPRHKQISARLSEITNLMAEHNSDKGVAANELTGLQAEKKNKKATLEQITGMQKDAEPALKAASRAEHINSVVQKIIEEIIPLQSDELAAKMTRIYKELSNKTLVKKVEIDKEFNVRLIDDDGEDIRETEMSAGEEQIFSQALISSVVEVSNFDFPMIIDTPLARLDDAHRTAILEHFKTSSRQIIFLSTDTEIIGKYFNLIGENLSNTFKLKNTTSDGVGYTTIQEGYF